MAIKEDVKKIQLASLQIISSTGAPNPGPARSYPSPTATYDEDSQFQSPFDHIQTRMRPMWRIQETALQQRKVTTTAIPAAIVATGIAIGPSTTNANLVAIPDLTIAVNTNGSQVQISWNVSASLSLNTASASFALFRDGIKIGQPQFGNSPTNNALFSVSQTIPDSPGLGFHSYSVYWSTTAGTLTANGKQRNISALILRPQ